MTRIAIIGSGGAGTAAAVALAGLPNVEHLEVFEECSETGGRAFNTPDQGHLCNTSVATMSLRADDDFHFARWLGSSDLPAQERFVSRPVYRDYLRSSLQTFRIGGSDQQIHITNEKISQVLVRGTGVTLIGESRTRHDFDEVVMAPGLGAPNLPAGATERPTRLREFHSPYDPGLHRFLQEHPGSSVGIMGTKLSAVDAAKSILAANSRAVMVSPSGDLPSVRTQLPLDSPFPIGSRRFKEWSSSPQLFRRSLRDYLAQFGERFGEHELQGEATKESPSSRLRDDIADASIGEARWQLAIGEFIDLANEHWSELPLHRMLALQRAVRPWMTRYVSAMPLENALLLDQAFSRDELVVCGFGHSILRSGKAIELHGPQGKLEELDALVWATGSKSPNWRFDGRHTLKLDGTNEGIAGLSVSKGLAVEDNSGQPLPHVWAVGELTRGRYPIVNYMRTAVLQSHDLKAQLMSAQTQRALAHK